MLMPEIDATHEHRHLVPCYFAGSGIVVWSGKAILLQPFHP